MLPKLSILIALLAVRHLEAQSVAGAPVWETLMQAPLPADAEPKISVLSLPLTPAPQVPRVIGAGHTHAGPVFAYILQGEIENQVEPDPPQIYRPGGFFYEAPGHVHRFMRNLSTSEPAKVIVFQAGNTGQPAPVIKLLLQEALPSTSNQELSLLRVTLPAGTSAESPAHSGPGIVYVLNGTIEASGRTFGTGDLFPESALRYRNPSGTEAARLLLYQVREKR